MLEDLAIALLVLAGAAILGLVADCLITLHLVEREERKARREQEEREKRWRRGQ